MKRVSYNSLRSQLLLWISLPVLVVLLTFALAGVQGHGQAMHDLVQTRADGMVRAMAALIDTRIAQEQDTLVRLSVMPVFYQDSLEADAVSALLASLQDEFTAGVALYGETAPIVSVDFGRWEENRAIDALLQDALITPAPILRTIYDDDSWFLIHVVPVPALHTRSSRSLVGVVPVSDLPLPELVRSVVDEEVSHVSLLGAEDDLLLSFGVTGDLEAHPVYARAVVLTTGWQVILLQSWAEWIPPVLRFGNMLLLVVLAAATLSVLSAYFGLQQIVYPLERLHRAINGLGQGNFESAQKPVGGVQEIEELHQALAGMAGQIHRYQQELRDYIGAMTLAQEEERKRLARELHDETVQALIALNQQIEMAEHRLGEDPERAAERLRALRPLIGETIAGIRRQIRNLRPLYLEDLGFVPALEMLVQQTAAQHGLVGDFEVSGEPQRPLAPAVEISGYRIVQEALQNVANHARASWVHVELIFSATQIILRIEDDGIGFQAPSHIKQLAQSGHFGLLGMQERARLHGGQMCIESTPGTGTTVVAHLLLS